MKTQTESINKPSRSLWIDHLRAFIIILVVAHHAAMSYTTWAYFNKAAYITSTHPIVDTARWQGFDVLINFNDSFFMSLMFLISGIFVIKGLQKKGTVAFVRDRFYRLFIVFIVGVTILMPIAYYPAYHVAHPEDSLKDHLMDFFTTEGWPVGPPWFLWVLFLFNLVFAYIYNPLFSFFRKATDYATNIANKPFKIFLWLLAIGCVLYLPAMFLFGAESWTGFGPFDFQKSRLLLYFGYFIAGCIAGANGTSEGIFKTGTAFNKIWLMWVIGAVVLFITLRYSGAWLSKIEATKQISFLTAVFIYRTIYMISATMSTLAFVTFFKKFVNTANRIWTSLSANSFGIYLLHYIFVVWIQYFLLGINLTAAPKFIIVFVGAFLLSWILSNTLRKIPLVRAFV